MPDKKELCLGKIHQHTLPGAFERSVEDILYVSRLVAPSHAELRVGGAVGATFYTSVQRPALLDPEMLKRLQHRSQRIWRVYMQQKAVATLFAFVFRNFRT